MGNTPESNIDPNGLSPFGASEYELRQRSRATTDGGGGEGATRASGNGWLGVPGGDPEGFFRFGQSDWAGAFTQRTEARIAQQNAYASFNQILGDAGYSYRIGSNGQWQGGGNGYQTGGTGVNGEAEVTWHRSNGSDRGRRRWRENNYDRGTNGSLFDERGRE